MNIEIIHITQNYENDFFITFNIKGVSRACLQQIVRHTFESYFTVKSTRYTLKELKNIEPFSEDDFDGASKFIVLTNDNRVNKASIKALNNLQALLKEGISNDIAKYALPESYKTELVWSVSLKTLQNFLELRTDKSAMWEIRELAKQMFLAIPNEYKYLLKDYVKNLKD